MSEPFIGEIQIFAASYVPSSWLMCDGTTLQISQYQALFAVIGNTYGGSAAAGTFALPNLNGATGALPNRLVCGLGQSTSTAQNWALAMTGGSDKVTLTENQLPLHTHQMVRSGGSWVASKKLADPVPKSQLGGLYVDATTVGQVLTSDLPNNVLSPQTVATAGGSGAHENRQPFLALYFAIAYDGVFPTSD